MSRLRLLLELDRAGLRKADGARQALMHSSNFSQVARGTRPPFKPEQDRIYAVLRRHGYTGTAEALFEQVQDD